LLHSSRQDVEIAALPDMKERLDALDFYPGRKHTPGICRPIKVEFETWRRGHPDATIGRM